MRMSGRARAVVRADAVRFKCLPDAGVRRLPIRAILDVAFPSISMRNAVARALCMRPQIVTECWCAVATALVAVYINRINGLRGLVEAKQINLHIFGSALGFDKAKQCLALPLHPDLPTPITRSSWDVLNGIQRFTWDVIGKDEVDCSKPPLQFDWYRTPIP